MFQQFNLLLYINFIWYLIKVNKCRVETPWQIGNKLFLMIHMQWFKESYFLGLNNNSMLGIGKDQKDNPPGWDPDWFAFKSCSCWALNSFKFMVVLHFAFFTHSFKNIAIAEIYLAHTCTKGKVLNQNGHIRKTSSFIWTRKSQCYWIR